MLASDPGRRFSNFSTEVTTLAKERLGHPKTGARRGGQRRLMGGPKGVITSCEISLKSLVLAPKFV